MMRRSQFCSLLAVFGLAAIPTTLFATPYAANVRNTTGDTWEFVLNEAADDVTVLRDGANPVSLGTLAAGRHTFDMTGFSTFDIQVQKSAATGWTAISDSLNLFTNFEQPSDVIVNNIPSSPYFGTIYVNNDRDTASASGRTLGNGIYAMTADQIGVELANNFAVVADPNDTSQAKAPSWTVTGSATSPWKITLDEAGNLIAGDWSDANGGIKYATPDLAHGGPLLIHEDGITPLYGNSADGFSGPEVHGSIVSRPYVTGSVGNNLVVYAQDEDQDSDGETLLTATTGNHIWRWDVGNVTNQDPTINPSIPDEYAGGYDQPPQLIVNVSNLPNTSDGRSNYLDLNVGVLSNATYSPTFNKWYLTENRNDGSQGGIVVVTPDGTDGNSPTLEWSSLQWSIDNNLDGFDGFPATPAGDTTDLQDVFRNIGGDVMVSPDGKYLIVHRVFNNANNLVLGTGSNAPGAVLFIPLDANGVPDLQVSGGQITNIESLSIDSNDSNHTRAGLAMDAAGNVYTTNNVSELLQVWSPGGSWLASTSGTAAGGSTGFTLTPLSVGLAGDYNGDLKVDAADYVMWRNDPGSFGGAAGYDTWRANFGATAPGSGSSVAGAAVPEPGTLALLAIGLVFACTCGARRGVRDLG